MVGCVDPGSQGSHCGEGTCRDGKGKDEKETGW